MFTYGSHDDEDDLRSPEGDSRRRGDPCFHYTVLDQAWRATNTTSKFKMCDRNVKWKGSQMFWKILPTLMLMAVMIPLYSIIHRLVPPLLQREEYSDAWEVRPRQQVRHPLPAVAVGASPEEKAGHRHPQCVRPLEEEMLRLPVQPHPGQEVSRQLLRLQVRASNVLLSGLLRRYWTVIVKNLHLYTYGQVFSDINSQNKRV